MNGSIFKFGDVFRHNEEDYVFLAQTDEIIYTQKILDKVITDSLKNMSDKIEATNSSRRKTQFIVLLFSKLKTLEIEWRILEELMTQNIRQTGLIL